MAYMPRRTAMANPARKRRPARSKSTAGGQRNAAPKRKRRLSLAQIAAGFGGKRRKSAAGAAKKRKRSTTANGTASTTKHRKRKTRKAKSNPGNIITAALGANPARPKRKRRTVTKGTSNNMARTKRRRRRATSNAAPRRRRRSVSAAPHRRRRRAASNPAPRRRRRRLASSNPAPRRRRSTRARRSYRNPSGRQVTGLVSTALYAIAGGVGSKLLTQAVLQGKNTGWLGYAGNLGVSFALGMAVKTFMRNSNAGNAVILGGVIQTVMRVLVDQTPLGETVKQFGVGDYMAQNYLAPQRVVDGLNSAALVPPVMPMVAQAQGVSGGNLY